MDFIMRSIRAILVLVLLNLGLLHAQAFLAQPAPAGRQGWKLGVALYTFHNQALAGQLDLAAASGVRHLEGFAFSKTGPEFMAKSLGSFTESDCARFEEMLKTRGLELDSLYVVADADLANWERAFAAARLLKVKYITAEPPLRLLDEIDQMAGRYGVKVAIHNHFKGLGEYWNPDVVAQALRNHPNLWACPDIGHWPKSGIDPVQALRKLEGRILAVHMKDISGYNNPRLQDVVLGTGVLDIPAVLRELERQGFSGWLVLERDALEAPDNLSSVVRSYAYLRAQCGVP